MYVNIHNMLLGKKFSSKNVLKLTIISKEDHSSVFEI